MPLIASITKFEMQGLEPPRQLRNISFKELSPITSVQIIQRLNGVAADVVGNKKKRAGMTD